MSNIGSHIGENRLCVVDVETTPHEIWQLTAIPSTRDFKPMEPFLKLQIRPEFPEKCDRQIMRMSQNEFDAVLRTPMQHDEARHVFDKWYNKLNTEGILGYGGRILPIAQNSPFDRFMVGQWLGVPRMEECFHPWHRCPMSFAQMINDVQLLREPDQAPPYPTSNLKVLAAAMGVENKKAHDATQDCLTTLEVYRRMLLKHSETL